MSLCLKFWKFQKVRKQAIWLNQHELENPKIQKIQNFMSEIRYGTSLYSNWKWKIQDPVSVAPLIYPKIKVSPKMENL